jgi:hypothetical protein
MSLLDAAFEEFIIMDKSTSDDGYGGVVTEWHEGATISGALVYDNSSMMKIAQAVGSTAAYTLTVRRNVDLDFYTVLKRVSDGRIFRILANSDDNKTPRAAHLDMKQYPVEEWKLN